jgi:hypothetical protein
MKKTSLVITLAFCVAIGFLIARLTGPSAPPAPPAPAKSEPVVAAPATPKKSAPAPQAASPAPAKRPQMDEAMKARFKAFGEETRQLALDLAGGDEKKLGLAFRNGMTNPATQEIFRRGREIGEAFRAAQTDAEREALMTDVLALREQGFAILKSEIDKLDAAPAAAPAAPAAPAPVIPAQGLM